MHFRSLRTWPVLAATLLFAGCAVDKPYYRNDTAGANAKPAMTWKTANSIKVCGTAGPEGRPRRYDLAYVEFNDEGSAWDLTQREFAADLIRARKAPLVFIYLHGWHNSARSHDVERFERALEMLSAHDNRATQGRPIVGVYLAWRGQSLNVPLLDTLTYYDRKSAAERLANGYGCFKAIRELSDAANAQGGRTLIVGHSFGGLVLERAVKSSLASDQLNLQNSLIVEMNAATESDLSREILEDLETRMRFNPAKRQYESLVGHEKVAREDDPYFVSITSQNDHATGDLFPAASWIWQIFHPGRGWAPVAVPGTTHSIAENHFLRETPGHSEYIHNFTARQLNELPHSDVPAMQANLQVPPGRKGDPQFLTSAKDEGQQAFPSRERANTGPRKLWKIESVRGRARLPYWIIQVPPEIINNHGGIWSDNAVAMTAALYRMKFPNPPSGEKKATPASQGPAKRVQDVPVSIKFLQERTLQ